jgi:hypothetical protein
MASEDALYRTLTRMADSAVERRRKRGDWIDIDKLTHELVNELATIVGLGDHDAMLRARLRAYIEAHAANGDEA